MTQSTKSNRIYTTYVRKEKQKKFFGFLRGLKIKKEDISLRTNGDFIIFDIDLSKKSNENFGKIRKILNEKQTDYL